MFSRPERLQDRVLEPGHRLLQAIRLQPRPPSQQRVCCGLCACVAALTLQPKSAMGYRKPPPPPPVEEPLVFGNTDYVDEREVEAEAAQAERRVCLNTHHPPLTYPRRHIHIYTHTPTHTYTHTVKHLFLDLETSWDRREAAFTIVRIHNSNKFTVIYTAKSSHATIAAAHFQHTQ